MAFVGFTTNYISRGSRYTQDAHENMMSWGMSQDDPDEYMGMERLHILVWVGKGIASVYAYDTGVVDFEQRIKEGDPVASAHHSVYTVFRFRDGHGVISEIVALNYVST